MAAATPATAAVLCLADGIRTAAFVTPENCRLRNVARLAVLYSAWWPLVAYSAGGLGGALSLGLMVAYSAGGMLSLMASGTAAGFWLDTQLLASGV